MSAIAEILEQELEEAVEVKNKKSLHRYIVLLTENIVRKENYEKDHNEIKSDIKTLAEIVKQGFERMDKRFEAVDKRFERMDKRFEDIYRYMEKQFEAVDKRFEDIYRYMEKQFEAVDKRFEDIYRYMDKRFEAVDKRFEDMNKKQSMMLTFMNLGFGIIILLTILFKFIV